MKPQVEQDIEDANLLASYLARNGVSGVGQEIVNITQIGALPMPPGGGPRAVPATFYADYEKLAKAAQPVSIASYRDSVKDTWFFNFRPATIVASIAAFAAVVCLFALGHLHSDWLELTNLAAQLEKLPPPLSEGARELKKIEADGLKNLLENPPAAGGDQAKPGGAVYDERIVKLSRIQLELSDETARAHDSLEKRQRNVGLETLNDLCIHGLPFRIFGQLASYDLWFESMSASSGLSERMLVNLQKVVLPVLYGVLGALVFSLRHVTMEAASRLFRMETVLEHFVRPITGGVAGFVIGWFMAPDKAGVIADPSVAPFALAFVGGYSLEVLFTVLDRITDMGKKT